MANYLALDAAAVKAEVAKLIEAYPELSEDETLLQDMVEGETDTLKVMERIVSELRDAETFASAMKEREATNRARRDRFERKGTAMKLLAKSIMRAAGLTNLLLPEATLSVTKPRASVHVLDVNELSQGFYRTVRQPDNAAIKSALEAGEQVPGAQLAVGEAGLTVRTK